MFESLWINKPTAEDVLATPGTDPATSKVAKHFKNFHKLGFCIISNAVPTAAIGRYPTEPDDG
jgi:hypothetical protein